MSARDRRIARMMADYALCECGHPWDHHGKGQAYGLETFHCRVCGCPEYSANNDDHSKCPGCNECGYD